MTMAEHVQLKYYFDASLAALLAEKIKPNYPPFKTHEFVSRVDSGVEALELKGRVGFIADTLYGFLPEDYVASAAIIKASLGAKNPHETGMFSEFYWVMPFAGYVEKYGLENFRISIGLIAEITQRNTGEYAIRPFIERYPKQTLEVMEKSSRQRSFHLRRLASEGLRPGLPWARKLDLFVDNPAPVFRILNNLKSDRSLFVRKSVANHMSDWLKVNEAAALKQLQAWAKLKNPDTRWIVGKAIKKQVAKNNPKVSALAESLA